MNVKSVETTSYTGKIKQRWGIWFPEDEDALTVQLDKAGGMPRFAGGATYQLRKFWMACPQIQNFDAAVDVGANVGLWTRVLAQCFEKVHAFEPMPENAECFHRNVHQRNVYFHQLAVGSIADTARMIYRGGNSQVATDAEEATHRVKMVALDDMELGPVDFIKIDTEGYEFDVVRGAEKLIRKYQPVIILEQKAHLKNAERYGRHENAATGLLCKWGAGVVAESGGDVVVRWKKPAYEPPVPLRNA